MGRLVDQADAGAGFATVRGRLMNVPGLTGREQTADERDRLADLREAAAAGRDRTPARRQAAIDQQEIDVELRQMWQAGGDSGMTT